MIVRKYDEPENGKYLEKLKELIILKKVKNKIYLEILRNILKKVVDTVGWMC